MSEEEKPGTLTVDDLDDDEEDDEEKRPYKKSVYKERSCRRKTREGAQSYAL